MTRLAAFGAAALTVLALAGCSADTAAGPATSGLTASDVDVDTPELRRAKERIGMEDCRAPRGGGPVEGGLPEVTLSCLGGGPSVEMAGLRGPLVLNVWQSFCGPCREEMPALQEFHERHGDQVRILGIDYQDTRPAAALELAAETGATYPSVADPGGELNGRGAFPVLRGLPFFVLVDADGRIAHVQAGGVEDVSEVVAMVEEHLGVSL